MITCTAYGPAGPAVYLATTEDFTTVERHGIIRQPEDKNAALLPHADRRPLGSPPPAEDRSSAAVTARSLLSRSDDLVNWSAPEQVLQPRDGRVVGLAADRHRGEPFLVSPPHAE